MRLESLRVHSCEDVYEPREDSYLLAEAVNKYAFGNVLDIGTGTGIQGIVAALNKCNVTFSDIDENAIRCAKKNALVNGVGGKFVVSDLFGNVTGKFNTIIFNPPYLESKGILHRDLDGGKNGRVLIDRFLDSCKEYVTEDHIILLLESSANKYGKDVKRLNADVVAKAHYFFEDIVVLLFK